MSSWSPVRPEEYWLPEPWRRRGVRGGLERGERGLLVRWERGMGTGERAYAGGLVGLLAGAVVAGALLCESQFIGSEGCMYTARGC